MRWSNQFTIRLESARPTSSQIEIGRAEFSPSDQILSAQVTTQKDRLALLRFSFELADFSHLDHILGQIKRIDCVYDAYRVVPRAAQKSPK